jgi:hypothetical protein
LPMSQVHSTSKPMRIEPQRIARNRIMRSKGFRAAGMMPGLRPERPAAMDRKLLVQSVRRHQRGVGLTVIPPISHSLSSSVCS